MQARPARSPASGPSATSSTSPTMCCSRSATRCTRLIWRDCPASHSRATRAGRRNASDARWPKRVLSPDMLVIADAERAVAVVGLWGRRNGGHERDDHHRPRERVLNPASVRRTSKKLGLKTEASMRFERGADLSLPVAAMGRAISLIEKIGAGTARGDVLDQNPKRIEPGTLRLRRSKIAAVLGASIPDPDVLRILYGLGFVLRNAENGWDVTVPTRRGRRARSGSDRGGRAPLRLRPRAGDVPCGYVCAAAGGPTNPPRASASRRAHGRRVFRGGDIRLHERAGGRAIAANGDLVPIANPLSENFAVLRPSVLPGLIDAGTTAAGTARRPIVRDRRPVHASRRRRTRRRLCLDGDGRPEHWSGSGRAVDFFDVKAIVERVCEAVGIEVSASVSVRPWLIPGQLADVVSNGSVVGAMGRLTPASPTLTDCRRPIRVRGGNRPRHARTARRRTRDSRRAAASISIGYPRHFDPDR